nr:hypothetical protein [Gemmatimonadaceae bacterium]
DWYRNVFAIVGGSHQANFDGTTIDLQKHAYLGIEFPNYWNLRTFVINDATSFDDRRTRGGPTVKVAGNTFGHLQVSTDPRRGAVFDVQLRGATGVDGTKMYAFAPGVALKPAANLFVQLSPSYSHDEQSQQYIRRQADATATAFGGARYVFSHLETRIMSLNTRVNWTMRPALTLQVFAQPFFASGDYSRFREFAAPRTLEMLDYGTDIGTIAQDPATRAYTVDPDGPAGPAAPFTVTDPNFSSRSLRGTAVLRWEYRPGSTMFFVWTQQRSGVSHFGDYDFGRDSRALLGDRPDNVFLVKATYWIGR